MSRKKIVCIVDNLNAAVLMSILLKGKTIDYCIIEEKNRFFSNVSIGTRWLLDTILAELSIKKIYVEKLPDLYFNASKTLSDLMAVLSARRQVDKILQKYHWGEWQDFKFYGSSLSTIMHFLPVEEKQIVHLDHGTEALFRIFGDKKKKNLFKLAAHFFDFRKYPNKNTIGQGYTLANCLNDTYQHISYQAFANHKIEQLLKPGIDFSKHCDKNLVLFLPSTQLECDFVYKLFDEKKKENSFSEAYEEIISNMDSERDEVIIKFHHISYLKDESYIFQAMESIRKICEKRRIKYHHIDDIFSDKIVRSVPAEILCKYMNIKKVFMMGSTTGLNIAGKDGKIACYSYTKSLKGFEDEYMNIYKAANPYIIHL